MEEVFVMQTLDQLRAFSHPLRYQALNLLAIKPMTGAQLARALKMPRQRLHYHIKILKEAGLILPVDEMENPGSVEIYYRSIAENFSSPLLANILNQPEDEGNGETRSQTLREISLTLIEQAKLDLNQPDVLRKMASLNSPFQHSVFLTPDQAAEAHRRFQQVKTDILLQNDENLATGERQSFTGIRYTLLVTPAYAGEDD